MVDVYKRQGMISGLKPGVGKVKVTSTDGTNIVATFDIKITSPETVSDIIFADSDNLFIIKGEEPLQLVWSVLPETAVNKSVKFISSDESIATVDAEGRVTALDVYKRQVYKSIEMVRQRAGLNPYTLKRGRCV